MRRSHTPLLLGGLLLAVVGGGVTAFRLPGAPSSTKLVNRIVPAIATSSSSSTSGCSPLPVTSTTTNGHGRLAPLRVQEDYANDDEKDSAVAASFFAQRGTVRPVVTALVWLSFVLYAFTSAPGMGEAARAADQRLIMDLIADPLAPNVTPLFAMVRTSTYMYVDAD